MKFLVWHQNMKSCTFYTCILMLSCPNLKGNLSYIVYYIIICHDFFCVQWFQLMCVGAIMTVIIW